MSELAVDDIDSMRAFVSTFAFRPITHFEIFAITKPDFPPTFDPLTDLALFLNAKLHICHPLESSVLPSAIVRSLFDPKLTEVFITIVHSTAFQVVDVLGCGVRNSDLMFALCVAGLDDTVYFYLDYDVGAIRFRSPGVQFQIRYMDALGRKIVRTMTINFSVADDVGSCIVNFDVALSAVAAQAADKYREFTTLDPISKSFTESKIKILAAQDAQVRLARGDRVAAAQIVDGLSNPGRLLSPLALAQVFGRSPPDVVRFLAPVGYALSLDSSEVVGPFTLTGRSVATGAYYIALPGGRGVLLLADAADVPTWAEALTHPPLSHAIAAICRESVVEILTRPVSGGHPLLTHIEKCIAGH
jgi:hypothetical protein